MWQDWAFGAYVQVSCTHFLKSLKKYSSYRFISNQNLNTVTLHLLQWIYIAHLYGANNGKEMSVTLYLQINCKCSFACPFVCPKGFLETKKRDLHYFYEHMNASQVLSHLF